MYDIDIISEALNLYEQGYTQKEIAIKLGCGERTVRRWLSDIKTYAPKTEEIVSNIRKCTFFLFPNMFHVDINTINSKFKFRF